MAHSGKLLFELFVMFAGAKLLAEFFERLRQPTVIGEIIAGMLMGPSLLGLVHPDEFNLGVAEVGAIFLLFVVGLETRPRDLMRVGGTATLVASSGVAIPFIVGFLYLRAIHHSLVESIFVGAAMVATSVGITARVLADLGVLQTRAARVILASAVLDDILGMIVLAVVSSLSTGKIHYGSLITVTVEAVLFSLLVIVKVRMQNAAFILSLILCLGLSLAFVYIGMAAIIGAFLAGLALAEYSDAWKLQENAHPIYEFLAPFFFVMLGVQIEIKSLAKPGLLPLIVVVSVLAIISKMIGCGLGAAGLGWKDALRVGIGMVPRGEVGLIVAAVGLNLHTISDAIYAVVLFMSMITTLFAPPALRLVLRRTPGKAM